jgi:hypothetical protein
LFSSNLGLTNISTSTIHPEVGFLLFCLVVWSSHWKEARVMIKKVEGPAFPL